MNSADYLHLENQHREQMAKARDEEDMKLIVQLKDCPAFEKYWLRRLKAILESLDQLILSGESTDNYPILVAQRKQLISIIAMLPKDEAALLALLEAKQYPERGA